MGGQSSRKTHPDPRGRKTYAVLGPGRVHRTGARALDRGTLSTDRADDITVLHILDPVEITDERTYSDGATRLTRLQGQGRSTGSYRTKKPARDIFQRSERNPVARLSPATSSVTERLRWISALAFLGLGIPPQHELTWIENIT